MTEPKKGKWDSSDDEDGDEKLTVNPGKWKLYQYNDFLGFFDVVVIAHNGKCADKLLSTAGTVQERTCKQSKYLKKLKSLNRFGVCVLLLLIIQFFSFILYGTSYTIKNETSESEYCECLCFIIQPEYCK